MKGKLRLPLIILFLILCCPALSGSGRSVIFKAGLFSADSEEICLPLREGELSRLDYFTGLEFADLSGSEAPEEILKWAQLHRDTEVIYTVPLPDGAEALSTRRCLSLEAFGREYMDDISRLITLLPGLETVSISSELEAEDVAELIRLRPDVRFQGSLMLLGKPCPLDTEKLSLPGLTHSEAHELIGLLPVLRELKSVELGQEALSDPLDFEDIAAMKEAAPEAEFNYSFSLYGRPFTLADEIMDLKYIPMDDEGELALKAARCMNRLKVLDMDSCGVSNEAMAEIRDALPDTSVIWRIWFGNAYSVRTDVERILASNPGLGGEITSENSGPLQYCTKVKLLDLGHNDYMDDISFVASMPELEVAILAMGCWSDAGPLANCPKLEYLEIQTTDLADLRPLSGLKNLKHLNIGYLFALRDISPLYSLTGLERLWIGCLDPVPPEQIAHMQQCAPDCVINTRAFDPTSDGWRYTGEYQYGAAVLDPRYRLLREQFQYGGAPYTYAYYWNDPLCPVKLSYQPY